MKLFQGDVSMEEELERQYVAKGNAWDLARKMVLAVCVYEWPAHKGLPPCGHLPLCPEDCAALSCIDQIGVESQKFVDMQMHWRRNQMKFYHFHSQAGVDMGVYPGRDVEEAWGKLCDDACAAEEDRVLGADIVVRRISFEEAVKHEDFSAVR